MTLSRNLGRNDRVLRAVTGFAAVLIAFTGLGAGSGHIAGILAALVGAVLLVTAAFAVCPAYVPFRFSTTTPRET